MKKILFIFAILLSTITFAQTDSTIDNSITPYVAAGVSMSNTDDFNNASYVSAEVGVMYHNITVAGVIGRNNLASPSGDKESINDYWVESKVAISRPLGCVSGYGVLGIGTYIGNNRMFIEYGVGIAKEFGNLGSFLQVSSWDGVVYITPVFLIHSKTKTMNILKPFEETTRTNRLLIILGWLGLLLTTWFIYGMGDTHLFPTMSQVGKGFIGLYQEGLVVHIASSLWLCARAVFFAILISLSFVYLSPTPILRPVSNFLSKFRYLPLTGIAFYITMLISDARSVQVWILVIFMTTFLITSLLSMLKDIKEEEFDHARALGCNRWEILWEVVIKGRFDYVIETIRQNLAIVWMMLVTVESIMAAAGGLGFLIKNSDKFMNHGRIIALQIVILFVGLGMDYFLTKFRKLMFRYSKI